MGAADFAHWESNENHWAYYGLGCYQCFYSAARQGFGVFFFPSFPHGSVIASSGGLIRHFGALYSFVNTRRQGKFCLITHGNVGAGWLRGCIVIDCTPYMLIMKKKSRDFRSRRFPKWKNQL